MSGVLNLRFLTKLTETTEETIQLCKRLDITPKSVKCQMSIVKMN